MTDSKRFNIFICHSTHDENVVSDLRVHLNPLFASGDIRIWEDSMLFAGEKWDIKIHEAMEKSVAAIFLVSPQMLNSTYVRSIEIPHFLALAEQFNLRIYCLYVEYSVVDAVEFTITIGDDSRTVKLTDFQGLNSPEKPISHIRKPALNKLLSEVAKVIHKDVGNKVRKTILGKVAREPILGRKTIYIDVEQLVSHKRYKKQVKRTKTYPVHWYEDLAIHEGDIVEFMECRPISKTKSHVLIGKYTPHK